MIGKLGKGRGAGGLCSYLMADHDHSGELRPRAEIIGGTMAGTDAKQLAREFGMLHQLRPSLGVHIVHMSLSAAPDDRPLSDDEWNQAATFWTEKMGFERYAIFSHGDHVHIAASRVRMNGSVISDSNDWKRSESTIRDIEKIWRLQQVAPSHLLDPSKAATHRKAPGLSEIAAAERGEVPAQETLRDLIDAAVKDGPTVTQFIARLQDAGIMVNPNISDNTQRLSGFSYDVDGRSITAKALGRKYTISNLQKLGLTYEPNRDFEACSQARDRAANTALIRSADDSRTAPPDTGADRPGDGTTHRSNRPSSEESSAAQRRLNGAAPQPGRKVSQGSGSSEHSDSAGRRPSPATSRPGQNPDSRDRIDEAPAMGGHDRRWLAIGSPPNTRPLVPHAPRQPHLRRSPHGKSNPGIRRTTPPPFRRDRLHHVSELALAAGRSQQPQVLLPAHVSDKLEHRPAGTDQGMRRATPAALTDHGPAGGHGAAETESDYLGLDGVDPDAASRFLRRWAATQRRLQAAVNQMSLSPPPPPPPAVNFLVAIAGFPSAPTARQIAQQLATFQACGVETFEIQAIPPKARPDLKPQPIRRFSADKIKEDKTVGWYRRQNAMGYDIYVRPAAPSENEAHPLVFIDDVDKATVDRIQADGLPFVVLIESSTARYHGWIRISDKPIPRATLTQCGRMLAQRYGGDPGAIDWRRYGRLSGFTNQKPSRKKPDGRQPFAELRVATSIIAPCGADLIEAARAAIAHAELQRLATLQIRQAQFRQTGAAKADDPAETFQRAYDRSGGQSVSERDFSAILAMIRRGHTAYDIRAALIAYSPEVLTRHPEIGHSESDYIARSIAKAQQVIDSETRPVDDHLPHYTMRPDWHRRGKDQKRVDP